MEITSSFYFLFIAILVVIYYLLPPRMQNVLLLLASYLFIILWNWQFSLVLLVITIFHYEYSHLLSKKKNKIHLWIGIGLNILLLFFFRSVNFFLPETEYFFHQFGLNAQFKGIHILFPIGLSYHVLQNISYLVDVSRGQIPPANNLIHFALYLAYFPKLLAGPIERARSFIPKLTAEKTITDEDLTKSVLLIVVGLVRKLVIADSLSATIPSLIFEQPSNYSPIDLVGWLVVYAFVIYNDFAGYTSIARGVSGLFGIDLSINFDYPYFSRNFSEFWNRWHITLSHWLRDYIYYPISRRSSKTIPDRQHWVNLAIPPLITMLASGLWHGLSWHMVFWGALHGIYQIVERIIISRKPIIPPDLQPLWRQLLSNSIVFFFVLMAWVPFRMELPIALDYWKGMLNFANLNVDSGRLILTISYLGFLMLLEWFIYKSKDEFLYLKFSKWVQAGILAVALILILVASATETGTPFIYQGF